MEEQPIVQEEIKQKRVKKYGDRAAVFQGLATMTKGKLVKEDLVLENGVYKSKKAIERGKAMRQGKKE